MKEDDMALDLSEKGVIFITGEIDQDTEEKFLEDFYNAVHFSNTNVITIYIDSPGGDLFNCINMCNHILSVDDVIVDTVCLGEACSAGLLILLCGKNRSICENTVLMSHDFTWTQTTPSKEHGNLTRCKEHYDNVLKKIMSRTCLSNNEIDSYLQPQSRYIFSQEALEKGFATILLTMRAEDE